MLNNILGWTPPLPRGDHGSWMYPIMITIGFVVAIVLTCIKLWKKYKVPVDPFYWFIIIGVPTGILGANFGSCVLGGQAGKQWSEFFTKFGQGLAIEWGVLFVLIAAFIYFPLILRRPKYKIRDEFGEKPAVKSATMWFYLDALAPCVLLAQFLGRWGNYFNQEVYGTVVTSQGLINFLEKVLPGMFIDGQWRQPLFLWEGIGNLCMFFVLYFGIEAIKQKKVGDLTGAYCLWYGTFRACLEPLRDSQFGTKTSLIFSIIIAVVGALFIVYNHLFMARARDKKALKLVCSPFIGIFIKSFFINKQDKEINIKYQNKVIDRCQNMIMHYQQKIEELSSNNQDNKLDKRIYKTTEKKTIWTKRLEESQTKLLCIQDKNELWSFPLAYIKSEEQKKYFGVW